MADYGVGVSRTLTPRDRNFNTVVFQGDCPPLDSEINLSADTATERLRTAVLSQMPSGFLLDPTLSDRDFQFDSQRVNSFVFGRPRSESDLLSGPETQPPLWANVNGWIFPVAGTLSSDAGNLIRLYPPPETDTRVDLVLLEAWACVVEPGPSTTNKPSSSTLYKFGNRLFGGTNLPDDLEDPSVGSETTKRVQVQYRLRVHGSGVGLGSGVNLAVHPDGLGDPNVLGQGAGSAPLAGMLWSNMRAAEGDPGLWRAGNGDPNNGLGTVDGYTYALPVCAVFRRNSSAYVAQKASGNPNQNGSFHRAPGARLLANPLDGARLLSRASLSVDLGHTQGVSAPVTIAVTNLSSCGLEDSALVLPSVFLRLGSEIVGVSAVDTVGGTITIPAGGRGRWGTTALGHAAGTPVEFFNSRPDGLFADEIAESDILDLRHAVNPADWDYTRLLTHNVSQLLTGKLHTAWKRSNPGDTEGVRVHEVADLYAGSVSAPNHSDPVDGPDGIRTIWSDAATLQPDVTLLCDPSATRDVNGLVGFTNPSFDTLTDWDVGADFKPSGFVNSGGADAGWYNGSSIHLFLGGSTGSDGARGTFRAAGVKDVRFVTPQEYWRSGYPVVDPTNGNQHPVTLRFLGEKAHQAPPGNLDSADLAHYPGPLYPWREARFERPFMVLGGLLRDSLRFTGVPVSALGSYTDPYTSATRYTLDLASSGVDFDAPGGFYPVSGVESLDASQCASPLLRDSRTLFDMLTSGGVDRTGESSEVYLLTFGDPTGRNNNGGFRVLGAGTVGYTEVSGSTSSMLVVEPLSADFSGWSSTGSGHTLTCDLRSQYHNAEDVCEYASRVADLVLVMTDLGGEGADSTPWSLDNVGDLALQEQGGPGGPRYSPYKAVVSTTLLYHPGRAATPRVPDEILRLALRGGSEETIGSYLRQSPSALDTSFSGVGTATDETYWAPHHVQSWNRLSSLGWYAPFAPSYGGRVVGYTEQDRESEAFSDRGSKTLVFRPYRNRAMTLQGTTWSELPAGQSLLGSYLFGTGDEKDPLRILTGDNGAGAGTSGKRMGVQVPYEFMPRFGRQDIPYYRLTGSSPAVGGFMPGINHLFTDVTDLTSPVFSLIGGEPNTGGTTVKPLFCFTRSSEIPYCEGNTSYGPRGIGALGARKSTDIDPSDGPLAQELIAKFANVNSSDLGRGLKGIQLPPYVGIARLYGVYEHDDYIAQGGSTFGSNRYQPESGSATNLLRTDVDRQTLFIMQDGAQDFTGETGDHTYVIPSNVLDLSRIAGYSHGTSQFEDFDYVVEASVFFFAKGFINQNNLVLFRKRTGDYVLRTDGDDPELTNVPMVIPSPAGVNDHLYLAYNRTVYQGDPYMTRDGLTRQPADYEARYGRLSPSQSALLHTAVQQFDSNGNFVPETPNARAFQVLASLDFHTTLGTGKIGGELYSGTPLDVGFVEADAVSATRMSENGSAPPFRVLTRAFTEGQKANSSRARSSLNLYSTLSMARASSMGDAFHVRFRLLDGEIVTLYAATSAFRTVLMAAPHNVPSTDIFVVEVADTAGEAAEALASKVRQHPRLQRTVTAYNLLTPQVVFEAVPSGAEGNRIWVEVGKTSFETLAGVQPSSLQSTLRFEVPLANSYPKRTYTTGTYLAGGEDIPVNGGNGTSQIALTGMTERLPLGVLVQDSDFLAENPLGDAASVMMSSPSPLRPVQTAMPLTSGGEEYTRFLGSPGDLLALADGQVAPYSWAAWTDSAPMGATRKYRVYRGGGAVYQLSGQNPGGPVDWVSDSFPASLTPVLKGGCLAGKALLVRNFYEEALPGDGPVVTSEGDEIQLVILTYAHFGDGSRDGILLDGVLSPSGYGEGYAAADRYRCAGRPMVRGHVRNVPSLSEVTLAVYPESQRG